MTDTHRPFNEALAALNAKNLVAAEALFRKVLKADSKHIPALNLITVVLMSQGRFSEAEDFIERATRLNRTSDVSFYNYGLISKHLNKPQQALDQFSKAIAINPNVAETWNNRGTVFNDLEQYDLALSDFNKAIALNERYAEAHANRGKSLAFLKRFEEALAAYDTALSQKPDLAEAWLGRGSVFRDLKRHDEAFAAFGKALSLKPGLAEAWLGRGNVLRDCKRHDEAFAAYDQALSLRPDLAEAWLGRGNVLSDLKRHDGALAAYDQALSQKPGSAEAWLGRGNVLRDLKRHDEALAAYDHALSQKSGLAEAWLGRGNVLGDLKRHDEALSAYDKALSLKPDLAEAWLGRGNVFNDLKRHDEALAAYDQALSRRPELADAWLGRGNLYGDLKRHDDALAAYDKALSLKPDLTEAWFGCGNVFSDLKRHAEAFAAYDRALSLKPDLVGAEGSRLNSKMQVCNWQSLEVDCNNLIASIRENKANASPFVFLGINTTVEDQHNCARLWVHKMFPPVPAMRKASFQHDKIRIGYVSADFHEHATAYLMAGVFEEHDKSRFETTAISIGPDDHSPMRRRLQGSFDKFVDANMLNDAEAASEIRAAEVDILIDLKGFTQGARTNIFARRAAPIQVNYLGYPGTMGATYIDYIVADAAVIPPSHQNHYSEKVVYLPNSYQANDTRRLISDRIFTRAEVGLPSTGFVFCCFNNHFKIVTKTFDSWVRILKSVPASVLWLFEDNATAVANICKEAAARGVDPKRLVFATRLPHSEHLARHRLADLFLDTLPYNAHTTASDALWAGLPVLTQIGETFAGRVAASLLNALHLPELITSGSQQYERQAIDLATNPEQLRAIKSKLDQNRLTAPLFDTRLFTRHLEAAYIAMYERHQAGLAPDHICVPD